MIISPIAMKPVHFHVLNCKISTNTFMFLNTIQTVKWLTWMDGLGYLSNIAVCYTQGLWWSFSHLAWWRHHMETFPALLAHCEGNPPVSGGFPSQRLVTQSFDVFFDLCPNKRLSKQSIRRWFEMPSRSLWRHYNGLIFRCIIEIVWYWWFAISIWYTVCTIIYILKDNLLHIKGKCDKYFHRLSPLPLVSVGPDNGVLLGGIKPLSI